MKLQPMPDGDLTNHFGLSHTWAHYADPPEMWEDVVPPDVPPEARPRTLWEALAATPPPDPTTEAPLRRAYHRGYFATVAALVAPLPTQAWRPHPTRRGVRIAHAGDGVVVYVRGERLYTAFRPMDFKISDYRCPPRDPRSVSIRRRLASSHAVAYVAHKTGTPPHLDPR